MFIAGLLAVLSLGLAREPVAGVACPQPNVTTCGRIGVAIWLTRPATTVEAELAGVPVRLHPKANLATLEKRGYWEGYVHISPSRLRLPVYWEGNPARFVKLQVTIRYPTRVATGTVRLQLRPGWG
jgi:hypothetical protein